MDSKTTGFAQTEAYLKEERRKRESDDEYFYYYKTNEDISPVSDEDTEEIKGN